MEHFGDVSEIKGDSVPAVDVLIGGSPCQDLSVAGGRKGLLHAAIGSGETSRSGLLQEEIRIIKEMRTHDKALGRTGEHVRPRFCVWENVPGAFSSNGWADFRLVLESFCKIAREDVFVPLPDDGRWENAGCIVGEGFSVAWRVMDARYWGVPQRRRRIALVADFGGKSAPEILFNEKGMRWDSEKSRKAWKSIAGHSSQRPASESKRREGITEGIRVHSGRFAEPGAESLRQAGTPSGIGPVFPDVTRTLVARADSSPCLDRGQPFVAYGVRENIRGETRLTGEIASSLCCGGGETGTGLSMRALRKRTDANRQIGRSAMLRIQQRR